MNIKQKTVMCCDNCHRVYVERVSRPLGCEYMVDKKCETCGRYFYKKIEPGKIEKKLFCDLGGILTAELNVFETTFIILLLITGVVACA